MEILQKNEFKKAYKRLHENQIGEVNAAIKEIVANPLIGEKKKGDLAFVRVHKFKMLNEQYLLAYEHAQDTIILLAVSSHENFYRDLKK